MENKKMETLICYSKLIELSLNFLTCLATIIGAILAVKNIKQISIENRFNIRLENYLKIVKPYFEVFKFIEILNGKCHDVENGDNSQKKSINFVIKNQLQTSIGKVNEYYSTYIFITLNAVISEILEDILNECSIVDGYAVDDDLIELLDVVDIQKTCDKILSLRKALALECAKLFNVDGKTFEDLLKKDAFS